MIVIKVIKKTKVWKWDLTGKDPEDENEHDMVAAVKVGFGRSRSGIVSGRMKRIMVVVMKASFSHIYK